MSIHSIDAQEFTATGEADEFAARYGDEARPAFTFTREIRYSRHTHDYDMYLDGEYRGSRGSYHQAEVDLDQLVSDLLHSGITATATQLDGGGDPDEIAADMAEHAFAPGEQADDVLVAFCRSCGDELESLARKDTPDAYCPACRESGEAAPRAEVNWNSEPLTLPQAVALACGEPEPAPQGPEQDTNWGGWRRPAWIGG